jgi:fumarate reductase flavoprotein subunit
MGTDVASPQGDRGHETDADVVIAGAGAAGVAAALAVADAATTVLLVDASRTFRVGSNTAMSTSMIPAGGTSWQREQGIDDSPQQFLRDIEAKTGQSMDRTTAEALTSIAPRLVEWLAESIDLPLELVTDFRYPGHSRERCHAMPDRSGRSMHEQLLARLADRPSVTLMAPKRLVDVDLDDGTVRAVSLSDPAGSEEVVRTGAVILATNGFGANADLVRRHIPEMADAVYHGSGESRGDALAIGDRLGADTGFLDAYQGHGSLATPHGVLLTWATVMHGAILVNVSGRRFGDETVGYSEFGERTVRQPGGVAWMILDGRIDQLCARFADYQQLTSLGAVQWASDADEAASIIGAPAEVLAASIARARGAADGEHEDEYGRSDFEAPLSPPFGLVQVTGALFHTQGGLRVDADARVLASGRPITGLYAAGGAAAGISGHGAAGYLAGNGLLSALGLGYLAGLHVARAIPDQ